MGWVHGEQSGYPFHHDAAYLVERFADKCDPAAVRTAALRQTFGFCPHPFGTRSRFAGSATAKNKPGPPRTTLQIALWSQLIISRPNFPIPCEEAQIVDRKAGKRGN